MTEEKQRGDCREDMQISFLGTRGSVSVSGEDYAEFGGATACVRILSGNQEIYVDAGSGIVSATPESDTELTLLLTHLHLDHLEGLPFFPAIYQKDRKIKIYAKKREEGALPAVLGRIFSPPFWPVGIGDYPADVEFLELPEKLSIGALTVTHMESCHPDGSLIFRFQENDSSFVYATDFEHGERTEELIHFADHASLLVYDGQYTEDEYLKYQGFGHSTASEGKRVGKKAGAQTVWITHHAPYHKDEKLLAMEREAGIHFARRNERVTLGE